MSRKLNKECISVNRILGTDRLPVSHQRTARKNFTSRHLERNAGSSDTAGNTGKAENCPGAPELAITDYQIVNSSSRGSRVVPEEVELWPIGIEAAEKTHSNSSQRSRRFISPTNSQAVCLALPRSLVDLVGKPLPPGLPPALSHWTRQCRPEAHAISLRRELPESSPAYW